MKPQLKVTMSALVIGVAAGSAAAQGHSRYDHDGGPRMQHGHAMHQGMMRMHGFMGEQGGTHGMGMMSGMHNMGLHETFDGNEDGEFTADEMRTGLEELRTEFDADGDGALSIDEFETLHSALIREMMVDRFQHLDADGDGRVTEEEMQLPARQMERMQSMHDRMMERYEGAGGGATEREGQRDSRLGHPMGGTGGAGREGADN